MVLWYGTIPVLLTQGGRTMRQQEVWIMLPDGRTMIVFITYPLRGNLRIPGLGVFERVGYDVYAQVT